MCKATSAPWRKLSERLPPRTQELRRGGVRLRSQQRRFRSAVVEKHRHLQQVGAKAGGAGNEAERAKSARAFWRARRRFRAADTLRRGAIAAVREGKNATELDGVV